MARAASDVRPAARAVRNASDATKSSACERAKRTKIAIWASAKVMTGSTSDRPASIGALQPAVGNPPAGSTRSCTANTKMSTMPITNVGIAKPTWASDTAIRPVARLRRNAARRPMMTAVSTAIVDEKIMSGMVTRNRLAISPPMSSPETSERPRSPRRASSIQSKYCTTSGRLNPYSLRNCSSAVGVALTPRRDVAMSPGKTRNSTNTITVEMATPTTVSASRRTTPFISTCY